MGRTGTARQRGVFSRAPADAWSTRPGGGPMRQVGAYNAVASGPRAAEALVERHAGLVKRIAWHLAGRLPPSVGVDDLIQSGMIGLLEAAAHFSADRGASFETYAGIRIRGAMIDSLRKLDWAPRWVHRKARAVAAAIREIEKETGRDAKDGEIATKMRSEERRVGKEGRDASRLRH